MYCSQVEGGCCWVHSGPQKEEFSGAAETRKTQPVESDHRSSQRRVTPIPLSPLGTGRYVFRGYALSGSRTAVRTSQLSNQNVEADPDVT
ncbi:unnamed protein product [Scytosiphon promiscuus]